VQFKQIDDTFFVYLEKNDSVIDELTKFCNYHAIQNGYVQGIGAVNKIELGSYDAQNKEYIRKNFTKDHELISFQGNIMLLGGKSFIHAHATIGNHDLQIFGGHVFKMDIAVVGEFIITKIDGKMKRTFDKDIGLATWDLR